LCVSAADELEVFWSAHGNRNRRSAPHVYRMCARWI